MSLLSFHAVKIDPAVPCTVSQVESSGAYELNIKVIITFVSKRKSSNHRRYSESQVFNFASWCIHVYLLAFTSSPDETKSTCTVERLFAFTPNHLLLVRHNYFLHNLQLFADFDFSVLQRVKVANSGHRDSLSSGPGWFRKQNSVPRREASRQPGEGPQKNSYQTL